MNNLSHCIRKPTKCLGENKGADQLRSNCEADQCLCFRYMDNNFFFLLSKFQNFQLLAIFCDCTAWFVSDLVGSPNCWFSHAQKHLSFKKMKRLEKDGIQPNTPCNKGVSLHRYTNSQFRIMNSDFRNSI